jgi:hypothetical protein
MGQPEDPNEMKRKLGREFLPDKLFNDFLQIIESSIRTVVDAGNDVAPSAVIFAVDPTGEGDHGLKDFYVPLDPRYMSQRGSIFFALGKQFDEDNEQPLVIYMSAIAVGAPYDESMCTPEQMKQTPQEREDRIECIIVRGLTMDGRTNMCRMDIQRDGDLFRLDAPKFYLCPSDSGTKIGPDELDKFFLGFLERRQSQLNQDGVHIN